MSETNGSLIRLGQKHKFQLAEDDSRTFSALLYDLHSDLSELRSVPKDQPEIEFGELLRRFVEMVAKKYKFTSGAPVTITVGEAELLVDAIDVAYAEKKTAARDAWRSAVKLPPSTPAVTSPT